MSIDANIIDCEWIKAAAKSAGIRTADLIALSMNNDPFYAGRPADWEKANWFAEIFERFGFGQGVHVRRIFYRCVTGDVLHWDGSVFENTDKHWSDIQNASKYARSLGIVDADLFDDRRNPAPDINTHYGDVEDPTWEIDIKLTSLALTHDQVVEYQLPRIPIKESVGAKAKFETQYGKDATELDALEALHPGTLQQLVRQAVQQYRDPDIRNRFYETRSEAESLAASAWKSLIEELSSEVDSIVDSAEETFKPHIEAIKKIQAELEPEIAFIRDQFQVIDEKFREAINAFELELPERPVSGLEPPDESDWLFDNSRGYLEQIEAYKSRR